MSRGSEIVAFDLSLTSTGWADSSGRGGGDELLEEGGHRAETAL